MLGYYFKLGIQNIKRNPILTGLMVMAIALGIGACMTTIAVDKLLTAHPLKGKENTVFSVIFEHRFSLGDPEKDLAERRLPLVQWTDYENILAAAPGVNHTGYQQTNTIVIPENKSIPPISSKAALVDSGFFPMMDVPFVYGSPWTSEMEKSGASIVVIHERINDILFNGENSVGKTVQIGELNYEVVGVAKEFNPSPKFYDQYSRTMEAPSDDFYIPASLKIQNNLAPVGFVMCVDAERPANPTLEQTNQSACVQLGLWIEVEKPSDRAELMRFLTDYAQEQKALGRFHRDTPLVYLFNIEEWIEERGNTIEDTKIMAWLGFLFLFVCLLNTAALLIGKFSRRSHEAGIRRAIGASRRTLFIQYVVESSLIGLIGGVLGLVLTYLGVLSMVNTYGEKLARAIHFDLSLTLLTFALAIASATLAGMLPAWRASKVTPATQLRTH